MDMKRLKFIEKTHNQAPPGTEWGVNAYQVTELIQTIKHQKQQIERYERSMRSAEEYIEMDRAHLAAYKLHEALEES